MNPYVKKEREAILKRRSMRLADGKGELSLELLWEEDKMEKLKREWDMNRKNVVRCTNNPSISELEVDVSKDLKLILHPRVKLIYDYISFAVFGDTPDPKGSVESFRSSFGEHSVYVDLVDIRSCIIKSNSKSKSKSNSKSKNYVLLSDGYMKRNSKLIGKLKGEVSIYFRDLSFIANHPHDDDDDLYTRIKVAREFLLSQKEFSSVKHKYNGEKFEYRARVPLSEDPDTMLANFEIAYPGYMQRQRPLIILYDLPFKLLAQPNSCEQVQEVLTTFLSIFGPIRYFNVSKDKLNEELCIITAEYILHDDFFNALKTLCCCSLRQEHSTELVDYKVTLGPAPSKFALTLRPEHQEKILSKVGKINSCVN